MLCDSIKLLIREEQSRQKGRFITHGDVDEYIAKLGAKAEILVHSIGGRCRGFVAFYCNDAATRKAYITLLLVAPEERGAGLGKFLVTYVLSVARKRGFAACCLEVCKTNQSAYSLYRSLGFSLVEEREDKYLLEVSL